MKQEDKTCEKCLQYEDGYCCLNPPVFVGTTRHGETIWSYPEAGKHNHCGQGSWVDEGGILHKWINRRAVEEIWGK